MTVLRFGGAAWKIAWRDLWSGRRHFAVAMASLAVGVAAMNASRVLGIEFSRLLNSDMRRWIAADAAVTLRQPPSEEQQTAIVELARHGVEATESLEAYGTAASDQAADGAMVCVKSVDPARYPWYGTVELEPQQQLGEALTPDTVVVSRPLAERLAVRPGDRMRLSGVEFRIAAILTGEPDRFAAAPYPYPRVVLSGAAFGRAQIARRGNAIAWRLLFRIAPASDIGPLKAKLQKIFPDGQVLDYRDHGDARVMAGLNAALTYLDLTAWTALVLGSLGVATVIYLHMEQRLDTVAIMKLLGGRWQRILSIYLLEVTCTSLAGGAIGAVLAVPLERIFRLVAGDQLPFPLALGWRWPQALEAIGLGVVSALAAAAVPLVAVRTTAPLALLRRYVEPPSGRRRIARTVTAAAVLAVIALAAWMIRSWKSGAAYLLGLAGGGLVLWAMERGLLRLAGWAGRRWRIHGARNLHRPGNHAGVRFVALSVGVMVVTASWLGPAAVVRAIEQSLPLPGSELFVFGLGPAQAEALREALAHDPDVSAPVELLPIVVLRLSKVADVPAPANLPERWVATCSNALPSGPLTAGRWWQKDATTAEIVVAESLAGVLAVRPGQTLDFYSNGRAVRARVVGLRRLDAVEELRGGLLFPCAAFAGLSVFYEAGITPAEGRAEAVRRTLAARFPSIPVISREEVAAAIQGAARDALWMLRAIAVLILAAGTAVLALLVLAEERTRTREIAILATLGARPRQVRRALLAEFAWLGALAGAGGGVMGCAFATLLLWVVFRKAVVAWDARVWMGAVALGTLVALLAGWASIAATIRRKPLAILRHE